MKSQFNRFTLEKYLAQTEQVLNLVGYIPMVSILTAAVRSLGGKCQILSGIFLGVFFYIRSYFSTSKKKIFIQNSHISFSHVIHGLLNIVRGLIEAVPCLSLLLCLPYDRLLRIRFRYSCEHATASPKEEGDVIDIT